jgi:hypothetical protein
MGASAASTVKVRAWIAVVAGIQLLVSCGGADTARSGAGAASEAPASAPPARTGAAAAGADERTVLVRMTSSGFSPNVLVLEYPAGRTVNVRVENADSAPHGLRIRLGQHEVGLNGPVEPGEEVSFSFTMPAETAQGEFFSPVGNDRERGFLGRAVPVVEAPGG